MSPRLLVPVGVAFYLIMIVNCLMCREEFKVIRSRKNSKYCSRKCYFLSRLGKPTWNKGKTGIFSKEALRKISRASKGRQHKLGIPAWNKGLKGVQECSDETRKKMSASHKGKTLGFKHTDETKKKISLAAKGRQRPPFTNEHKRKISEAHKGTKKPWCLSGKEHPNWKGGITPENHKIRYSVEGNLWRENVYARDDWTCQKCKARGRKLNPHHIRNFAEVVELRTSIENGITFCQNCHQKFHKIYGRKNNNQEQIFNFLKELCYISSE